MNPANRRLDLLRSALPIGLSALVLAAALSGCSSSSATPTPAGSTAPTASHAVQASGTTAGSTAAPTGAANEATKSASTGGSPATKFGDGTYTVGKDVKAGTYRATDISLLCNWVRYGAGKDQLGYAIVGAPTLVTILATDVSFKTDGCGTWTSDLSQVTKSKTSFGEGTYLVGTDVTPGTYKSDGAGAGTDKCFWARLSGFGGSLDETTQSNVEANPAEVVIRDTDKGFQSQACGTWTKE